ncbi:conserved Plasmodium protein, unknown function [Plasmodium chabaudi adami]|uniref:Uncharacterized protein n=1 Tax=Plasmodium chabaudi adami TaxID=5826 RepID=A0A1D3LGU5_PLACE|nr:conserved Plasmodium protein, unknown function [Plasmodium chabaudi adami]
MEKNGINIPAGMINDAYFCKTIKAELKKLTDEYLKRVKNNFLSDYIFKTEVFCISFFFIPLIAGRVVLQDNNVISPHCLTALFILIAFLLLIFLLLYFEINEAQNREFVKKIEKAKSILSVRSILKNKKDDSHFNYLTTSNFIFILRNNKWELLPKNLLIKNDVFLLHDGDLVPCRCVEYNIYENVYGKEYQRNEVFMAMDKYRISTNIMTKYSKDEKREYLPSFHLYAFVSYDNASIYIIRKYINEKFDKSKSSKSKENLRNVVLEERVRAIFIYIWMVIFSLSTALMLIYVSNLRKVHDIPQYLLIYWLAYTVLMSISILPFIHRIFSELIYGYCSSLSMSYENYFKDMTSYERKSFTSSFDLSSATENSSFVMEKKFALFYTLKSIFLLIFKGIKINKCYLNILSDCSVLCFLDSNGILVNANHSVKEICIYNQLNTKKNVNENNGMKQFHNYYNNMLTIIDIFMDNKSMYAYQRIQNIKILHSLFLISYFTQLLKYIKNLDDFQNNILNYMNDQDYNHLYTCMCDIGNISYPYNKFSFRMLFFCIENKSDYELYKKKNLELKRNKKAKVDGEIPYHVDKNEKGNELGINIYDNLITRDNFVFIFILYEKKKNKYHMFFKGQLDALVSKCMFYYDGKVIKKLKRRKKKVLKILNMQWISSGLESICFAYRPLSTDEINYLKTNFTKNIYILTINKRKVYNIKNFYNEPNFPCKENERFLSHLISTSIFIGNSAVKILTNNDIQARINDFYDAGIRFVYFSTKDQINTRNTSNTLGMETNWNTSISLSLTDKSSFRNRDGKVVIPSGINNIKTHIQEVDDIPLRVSSYSGCNQFNTSEMIKILLENNEIITCVGNSLNCCNFELYKLCNYSISVLLPYNNICSDCYGKKERSNPFGRSAINKNPLISYSSFVNSFPCNLTIEKNILDLSENIMELVYKLLKSSRIYKKNLSISMFYFYFYYCYLSFLLFVINIFFLPPLISVWDYLLLILFIIPILSISLLNNNNNSTIMNDIPDKVISIDFLVKKLFFFLIRWISFLTFSITVSVYYIHILNDTFVDKYVVKGVLDPDKLESLGQNFIGDVIHYCSKNINITSLYKCNIFMHKLSENQNAGAYNIGVSMIKQYQIFFFFSFSLFFFVSSLSYSDKYEALFKLSCIQNSKSYYSCLVVYLILSLLYVAFRIYMLPIYYIKQYPDTTLILLLAVFSMILLVINETLKRIEEKIKINRQKYLKVLFGTRLGMWSPK